MELSETAVRHAAEMLDRAIAGEDDEAAGACRAALGTAGTAGAYDMGWWLASAALGTRVARGGWRLDFPQVDEAPYETRWVARFLSAYANADIATAAALIRVADADGQLACCLSTLAASAAATLRRRHGLDDP